MDDKQSGFGLAESGVEVLRLAAFTLDGAGGNPAGVVLDAGGLDDQAMQDIAAEVGYPETAFLTPDAEGRTFRVRYFSPGAEVPFCGHATVASAVALAQRQGEGVFRFHTPVGEVVIDAARTADGITATFTSVEPDVRPLPEAVVGELLGLLGLEPSDLDASLPLQEAFAGNWHPVVAVADKAVFDGFGFEPGPLRELMDRQGWQGTVTVIHRVSSDRFEARNLFPLDDLTEDPATGSAAAALGGYLRALGHAPQRFEIRQGQHIGMPGRLLVEVPRAGGIRVTGTVREIS